MNLKHPPKCEGLAYPQVQIGNQAQLNVTRVLSISDSYYRGFTYLGVQDEVFDHGDYWYYYNKIYNRESAGTKEVWELDLKTSLEQNRVILLMATESALDNLGWGFIQQAYLLYTNPVAYAKWKQQADQLNPYKKAIRNSPALLDELTSESQQKKIPLDTLILQQARMMKENKQ